MTMALPKKNPLLRVIPKPLYLLAFPYRMFLEKLIFMSIKSFFLALALLVLTIVSHAQFKKGMRMVGTSIGSVLFNSGSSDITVASIGSNTSKITNYNISINPMLGWFISDKTIVGATLNINPNGQKTTYEQNGTTYQSDKAHGYNIGAGGFARNYFSSKSSMMPFGQISLNGGFSNLKTEGFFYGGSGPTAYKQTYTGNSNGGVFANAAFTLGLTKMVGENAGLDFFAGYTFSYTKNTFKKTTLKDIGNNGTIDERGENETTTKFTNHGFTLGVAFQIFLKEKKK